jgi:hypothetical protein
MLAARNQLIVDSKGRCGAGFQPDPINPQAGNLHHKNIRKNLSQILNIASYTSQNAYNSVLRKIVQWFSAMSFSKCKRRGA